MSTYDEYRQVHRTWMNLLRERADVADRFEQLNDEVRELFERLCELSLLLSPEELDQVCKDQFGE